MSSFVEKLPFAQNKAEESKFAAEQSEMFANDVNWYELRLLGKFPDRRSYHSSFIHKNR